MSLLWWREHVGKFWLAAVYAFFYLPLAFLVLFSFNSTRQDSVFTGFSLRWYEALLKDNRLVEGFLLSFKVALMSATLGTVLATMAAFALVRFGKFRGRTLFNAMLSSPLVMPEVIIGMSLLLLFVGMERLLGWPERGTLTIVLGHALLGMAYASVVIQSRLKEMDKSIEEAALELGCRPFQVFFLVMLSSLFQA
jgi:putrescine transport system permease protein